MLIRLVNPHQVRSLLYCANRRVLSGAKAVAPWLFWFGGLT